MAARTLTSCAVFAALLVALAACGRAGPLEPPPPRAGAEAAQDDSAPASRDRRFILDPLIE